MLSYETYASAVEQKLVKTQVEGVWVKISILMISPLIVLRNNATMETFSTEQTVARLKEIDKKTSNALVYRTVQGFIFISGISTLL